MRVGRHEQCGESYGTRRITIRFPPPRAARAPENTATLRFAASETGGEIICQFARVLQVGQPSRWTAIVRQAAGTFTYTAIMLPKSTTVMSSRAL
jgi:hypothetical protein